MFLSRIILASLALLIGLTTAAPVIRKETPLDLVARAPIKIFARVKHAVQALKVMHNVNQKFKPKAGTSVFWSGTSPSKTSGSPRVSVMHAAQHWADVHHSKTINHALADAHIKIPEKHENRYSVRIWDHASKIWAKKAHGEVHAILGETVRDQSVYKKIEKPALLKNKKVTKLIEHNAHTGERKVVKG